MFKGAGGFVYVLAEENEYEDDVRYQYMGSMDCIGVDVDQGCYEIVAQGLAMLDDLLTSGVNDFFTIVSSNYYDFFCRHFEFSFVCI